MWAVFMGGDAFKRFGAFRDQFFFLIKLEKTSQVLKS